ncbi:ABC transporter ATP-binding protein [Microbacterium sp. NPDC057650]|uniref:ABC transporter ATP-binding protein n=1 Tax=unclassified Microbacterium TaxID=2609290 RepID=UPI00366C24C3
MTDAVQTEKSPLLRVTDLRISVPQARKQLAEITHGVSFEIAKGGTVGLVGESGSGKSMTSLAIMGLLPKGAKTEGSVQFKGEELLTASTGAMRRIRGSEIAMIFQDPLSSLNPYYTVGNQIIEAYRAHNPATRSEARDLTLQAMERVGIPNVKERIGQFPHQFSGGMRQRIMIAMALVCQPALVIADEPTTALDVTVQARVLDLIRELQDLTGAGLLFITHDLAVVSNMTEDVVVLRDGDVQEQGPTRAVFTRPRSDYTRMLLKATPRLADDRLSPETTTSIPVPGSRSRDPWEGAKF